MEDFKTYFEKFFEFLTGLYKRLMVFLTLDSLSEFNDTLDSAEESGLLDAFKDLFND